MVTTPRTPINPYNPNSFTTLDALIMDAILERKPEISFWHIKGKKDIVSTTVSEHVWAGTGDQAILVTPQFMNISSTSAADDVSSIGAQRVKVWGVNAEGNFQVEIVDMAGTTPVTTVNEYFAVNRLEVVAVGFLGTNVADISANGASGGQLQEFIPASEVLSKSSHFQVAMGYTAIPLKFYAGVRRQSGAGRKATDFEIRVTLAGGGPEKVLPGFQIPNDGTSFVEFTFAMPLKFMDRDTVFITSLAETNNTGIAFFGFLAIIRGTFDFNDFN